ncbi:superoxide dismutase [Rhodococcus sp. 14-2470-1b]|jgi:Cu-Zn family superoxide dismutase|nr:superoxide dismutase [Rhodococcus sp. 15-1189-1-1a]OZF13731.1 superoxide dismutase [Rhodococcus sp. 14-2686-1-2]OZF50869.1 superoxide dismutase [Rhodococcus sp. 14-2470-1b]
MIYATPSLSDEGAFSMASTSTARSRTIRSWRIATPVVAVAAFGLVACTAPETPSDVAGTTPPVWTGHEDPSGHGVAADSPEGTVEAEFENAAGTTVGTVSFVEEGDHLVVTVEAEGLTPGFHGLHIHTAGLCEPNSVAPAGGEPGNFLSAGGHLQVDGRTEHPASGDLTSLQVGEDGTAMLVTTTDAVTMDDLRADGGRAVIIHEGPDNFANIPPRYTLPDGAAVPDMNTLMTGDAGGRAACAVLE